jgi:hypothetical protein
MTETKATVWTGDDLTDRLPADYGEQVNALFREMRPMLQGRHPAVQGAVVAHLAAVWIAGHNPELRADQQKLFLELITRLVGPMDRELNLWPRQ